VARAAEPAEGASPGGRFVVTGALPLGAVPSEHEGRSRFLEALAAAMPPQEVEAAWAFPALRREGREYGAAVVSRCGAGERRRVYRARWQLVLKGEGRGRWSVEIQETAEALPETLERVLEGVRRRADEAGEAEALDIAEWRSRSGRGDRDA
jgi:hypothetical protein